MTETDSTTVGEQFISGVDYGTSTANVIIAQFPCGWPKRVTGKVRKIIEAALSNVVDKLIACEVDRTYIDSFAMGFHAGHKQRFKDHTTFLIRTNQIG